MAVVLCMLLLAADAPVETGACAPVFVNRPAAADAAALTPAAKPFDWRLEEIARDDAIAVKRLTFPSPVKSPHECNNTVWCEYYAPHAAAAPGPAAIVLHFLYDKDFRVTRFVCDSLARRGIPSLMVKLAYYGERRPPSMPDFSDSLEMLVPAWLQSVQDVRCALAWLGARPEVDPHRAALVGVSLGAFVGGLVLSVDARLERAVLVLGGGNLNEVLWSAPETARLRAVLSARGLTRAATRDLLAPIEPLRFAAPLPPGTLLMINARNDTTVPPACAQALADAFKADAVRWHDTTHTGLAVSLFAVLDGVSEFLQKPAANRG